MVGNGVLTVEKRTYDRNLTIGFRNLQSVLLQVVEFEKVTI